MTPIRALVIDDTSRDRARAIVAYAETHPYHIGGASPGNDPGCVAQFGTYRTVFSFTHAEGRVFRHLSVSVPSQKLPHPVACFAIASLFGFTGWDPETNAAPDGWQVAPHPSEHCVVLIQERPPNDEEQQ
jgi:hypothetical protein